MTSERNRIIISAIGIIITTATFISFIYPGIPLFISTEAEWLGVINKSRIFEKFFSVLSNYAFFISISVPVGLIIYSHLKKLVRMKGKSIHLLLCWISGTITNNIIKHSVNRPRPFRVHEFIEKMSSGGSPSFPSGHTTDIFIIAFSFIMLFPKHKTAQLTLFFIGLLIAYSRMSLGVHYISDVVGAIGLAMFSSGITLTFIGHWSTQQSNRFQSKKIKPDYNLR